MKKSRWSSRFDSAAIGGLSAAAFDSIWWTLAVLVTWAILSSFLEVYDDYRNGVSA